MEGKRFEMWQQYEKLLIDSIKKNHHRGLSKLLSYENNNMQTVKEMKETCSLPLITAVEQKNVPVVNLLRKYGYKLPLPHSRQCNCHNCVENKFGLLKQQMRSLRAVCDPIWISLTADDPFSTIFRFSRLDVEFSECIHETCFQKEYDDIYEENNKFIVGLLDCIESEAEGATVMKYKNIDSANNALSFIDTAIHYNQKDVISHPVIQYHLNSQIFGDIPRWKDGSNLYKTFLIGAIAIMYPITSLLNIFVASPACPPVAYFTTRPFVRLINGAASFLTFLGFLIYMGASDRNESSIRTSNTPTGVEFAVLVWVIGFCFAECKEIYSNGVKKYFANGWNWVDVAMDFFLLITYVIWIVLLGLRSHRPPLIDSSTYENLMYVADGTFSVAIILSFFRLLYLCQVTSYLGLLQICLGEMILVIFQFMVIEIIVLLAFTVAMGYLSSSSKQGRVQKAAFAGKYTNDTAIYSTFAESFNGFFSTFFTMVYVSLGVEGTSTLINFEDGSLIHLWANIMFISYIGISMIVLLNILIAMMNSSYNIIADNIQREHLFSQTKLWMEYMGDKQTRPVPFNLIPSVEAIVDFVRKFTSPSDDSEVRMLEKNEENLYKSVCEVLVKRYLEKEYENAGLDEIANTVEDGDQQNDNDSFLQSIEKHMNSWTEVFGDEGATGDGSDTANAGGDKDPPVPLNPGTILVAPSDA